MATTTPSLSIPFSASHIQQPFKLLELPADLLALLESDNPPTLKIQSQGTPTPHAHLTVSSTGKSYLLRQKNTSNPLMLLKPTSLSTFPSPSLDDDDDAIEENQTTSKTGLTRISVVEDTIELIEVEDGGGDKEAGKVKQIGSKNKWHEKFAKSRGMGSASGKS